MKIEIPGRKKTARKPWYVSAFEKDYLRRYAHRSDEAAAAEITFALSALDVPPRAKLLDLCCGAGRHSRALAAAGFSVIGIDLSADLLRVARGTLPKDASKRAGRIEYIRADMRRLPLPDASVDGVVSMFTSFGYFSSERENARVLGEVARVLKSGAPFLMDYFNLKTTLQKLEPFSERTDGTIAILERRRFNAKTRRLMKTIEVLARNKREVLRESVRAYAPRELKALFKLAGLKVEAVFGDLAGAKFDAASSPRCVLLARRAGH